MLIRNEDVENSPRELKPIQAPSAERVIGPPSDDSRPCVWGRAGRIGMDDLDLVAEVEFHGQRNGQTLCRDILCCTRFVLARCVANQNGELRPAPVVGASVGRLRRRFWTRRRSHARPKLVLP